MMELHDLIRGKAKQVSLRSDIWKGRSVSHLDAVPPLVLSSRLQMAFAHDSVRVLQCFLQFGSHEQRQLVFEELKGEPAASASSAALVWHSSRFSTSVPLSPQMTWSICPSRSMADTW